MEYKVDGRGLACPLPVVNTKNTINTMKVGELVTVLVDNEIAVQNVRKFAAQMKHKVVSEKKTEDYFELIIEKAESGNSESTAQSTNEDAEAEEFSCDIENIRKGTLVVLSADTMGSGEEELGKALMKAFVFALTKQDALPERILMYNTGAFLSCEGSASLEDLQYMETAGVEIMTCGTCLNFYELTEKLKVGTITNMYDIVEKMNQAKHIIRP